MTCRLGYWHDRGLFNAIKEKLVWFECRELRCVSRTPAISDVVLQSIDVSVISTCFRSNISTEPPARASSVCVALGNSNATPLETSSVSAACAGLRPWFSAGWSTATRCSAAQLMPVTIRDHISRRTCTGCTYTITSSLKLPSWCDVVRMSVSRWHHSLGICLIVHAAQPTSPTLLYQERG